MILKQYRSIVKQARSDSVNKNLGQMNFCPMQKRPKSLDTDVDSWWLTFKFSSDHRVEKLGSFVTSNINGKMCMRAAGEVGNAVLRHFTPQCAGHGKDQSVSRTKQRKRISGESRDKSKVEPRELKRNGTRVIYAL